MKNKDDFNQNKTSLDSNQSMLKNLVHQLTAIDGVEVVRIGKVRNVNSFEQKKLRVVN